MEEKTCFSVSENIKNYFKIFRNKKSKMLQRYRLGQCYSKCGTRTGDGTRAIVCRYVDIFQKREIQ